MLLSLLYLIFLILEQQYLLNQDIDEMPDGEQTRRDINRLDSAAAQYDTLAAYLEALSEKTDRWMCAYREG